MDARSGHAYWLRVERRHGAPQTGREIQLGRQLGAQVAVALVEEISKMGFAATRAADGPPPQPGDLVIKVEFFSIDEGSRTKRMLIRFGAGASELKTFVEGYQDTATGLRPLGSVEIEAGGGKMPGMIVPVAGGAVAGSAAASAAVRGTLNISQEMSPESIRGTAKRKAEEIAKVFSEAFKKRGWI